MKIALLPVCVACLLFTAQALSANETKAKTDSLTLEDVIFDVSYLKKALGPKTLLAFEKPTTEIPVALSQALTESGLAATTKFVLLPPDFSKLKLKDSIAYNYPQKLRRNRTTGEASFLAYIGADGAVKTIYCYQNTDRTFALAVAAAVVRWKYEPIKIKDTAVPLLYVLNMQYRGDNTDTTDMQRERIAVPIPPPPAG